MQIGSLHFATGKCSITEDKTTYEEAISQVESRESCQKNSQEGSQKKTQEVSQKKSHEGSQKSQEGSQKKSHEGSQKTQVGSQKKSQENSSLGEQEGCSPEIDDHSNEIIAAWWRDRRDVVIPSTMHSSSVSTVLKCPNGCREKKPIPYPSAIIDYNNYMGGVDQSDGPTLELLFTYN